MNKTALIEIKGIFQSLLGVSIEDGGIVIWRLYCAQKGEPEHLGKLIWQAIEQASVIDPSIPHNRISHLTGWADRFVPFLCAYLWKNNYTEISLTRIELPVNQQERRSLNINYVYKIILFGNRNEKPEIKAYKLEHGEGMIDVTEKIWEAK